MQALGLFGRHDVNAMGHNSSAYLHLLAQALKFGFADRANVIYEFPIRGHSRHW